MENVKELKLKLLETELVIIRKELTEVKSHSFVSTKYEDLKLEHDQLLKVNKELN